MRSGMRMMMIAVALALVAGPALAGGKLRFLMTPPIGAIGADRGFCQVANGGSTDAVVLVEIYRSSGTLLFSSEATIPANRSESFGSGTHLTQFCKVTAPAKVLKRLRVGHVLQTPTGQYVADVQAY